VEERAKEIGVKEIGVKQEIGVKSNGMTRRGACYVARPHGVAACRSSRSSLESCGAWGQVLNLEFQVQPFGIKAHATGRAAEWLIPGGLGSGSLGSSLES